MDDDEPTLIGSQLVEALLDAELKALRLQVAGDLREQVVKVLDERGTGRELVRQQPAPPLRPMPRRAGHRGRGP